MSVKREKMAHLPDQDEVSDTMVTDLLVKLVAAGLKEASMDSPSFRASMNHSHLIVMTTANTLNQLLTVYQNIKKVGHLVKDAEIGFLQAFNPIIDGSVRFLDKDLTFPCLENTFNGMNIILSNIIKILNIDETKLRLIESVLSVDVPNYLQLRKDFDIIQTKYDFILAKYLQLPKNNPSIKTREDALQLYEIRKQYIHTSMTIWTTLRTLESKISFAITEATQSFWNPFISNFNNLDNINGMPNLSNVWGLSPIINQIEKLDIGTNVRKQSNESLLKVLTEFRRISEENLVQLVSPSSDLSLFESITIDPGDLKINDPNTQREKHGWVFIKSNKLDGSKGTLWIKRWMFIRDGTFGFLAISQDGQYVEESDKIGVLLVNVSQSFTEDRKFTMDITGSLNLTIQLETFNELRSWLTMFKFVQNYCQKNKIPTAGGRFEPILDTLKIKPVVSKDVDLIQSSPIDPTIERMKHLMEQKMSLLSYHLNVNVPIETSATLYSVLSNLYMSTTPTPSASRSNFWGYVNWGIRNVMSTEQRYKLVNLKLTENLEPRSVIDLRYPDFYPDKLRLIDLEVRAIFDNYIARDKFALMHFNASWSPNAQQSLFCNIYVNTDTFYCYSNNCGLISILPLKLTNFLYSEVVEKQGYQILRTFFVSGVSIKMKIFQGNAYLIKDQLNYILKNMRSAKPADLESIIEELDRIALVYERKEEEEPIKYLKDKCNIGSKTNNIKHNMDKDDVLTAANPFSVLNNDLIGDNQPSDFDSVRKLMDLVWSKKYNLPAKALFHVLFGDDSYLLQCTLPLASSIYNDAATRQSMWRCDSKQKLTRCVWNSVFKMPCCKQTIENMINNKYYSVVQETPNLKLIFGFARKISMRFVISSIDSKSCRVLVYYSINSIASPINWFHKIVMQQIMIFRLEALDNKLFEVVKRFTAQKRKIAYAIKSFGAITKYDSNEATKDELSFNDSVTFIPLQLFSIFYYEKLNFQTNKIIHRIVKAFVTCVKVGMTFLNANIVLITMLGVSLLLNIVMSSMTGYSYWRERNVISSINEFRHRGIMERSISLKEIGDLITNNETYSKINGECYSEFLNHTGLNKVGGELSDNELMSLRIERNRLLTKLNLVNDAEHVHIANEWFKFVMGEVSKCNQVKQKYPEMFMKIESYCTESQREYEMLL